MNFYKTVLLRSLSSSRSRIEVTKDRMRLNNKAQPKFAMVIPSTNLLARPTTIALTINKNRPRVTMVTGSVSKIMRGFIKMFRIASTTANTIAVQNESMWMPFNTWARPNETAAMTRMRIRNLIVFWFWSKVINTLYHH